MEQLKEHIDKQELSSLPPCDISGNIIVIDRPQWVNDAVCHLWESDVIGFDTETKPSFRRGVSNSISLLQLANFDTCYLFRLKMIGESKALKDLLESNSHKKIGLSVHDDFHSLNQWMNTAPKNFIELQKFVKAFGIEEMSLQKIYAIVFGQKMSKRQQLSNWDADILSPAQQLYAATDAWACLRIYHELHKRCSSF